MTRELNKFTQVVQSGMNCAECSFLCFVDEKHHHHGYDQQYTDCRSSSNVQCEVSLHGVFQSLMERSTRTVVSQRCDLNIRICFNWAWITHILVWYLGRNSGYLGSEPRLLKFWGRSVFSWWVSRGQQQVRPGDVDQLRDGSRGNRGSRWLGVAQPFAWRRHTTPLRVPADRVQDSSRGQSRSRIISLPVRTYPGQSQLCLNVKRRGERIAPITSLHLSDGHWIKLQKSQLTKTIYFAF